MRRVLLILIAVVMLGAACGDDSGGDEEATDGATTTTADAGDGGGSGTDDEFCTAMAALADIDITALPTAADLDLVREAAAAAPDELQADFDRVIATIAAFTDPGGDITEAPEVSAEEEAAINERLTAAASDCGVEVPIFAGTSTSSAEDYESGDLRAAIEADNPALEGRVRTIGRVNTELTVQIADLVDVDEALAACESAVAYTDSIGFDDATVNIADTSDEALARREAGAECAAA